MKVLTGRSLKKKPERRDIWVFPAPRKVGTWKESWRHPYWACHYVPGAFKKLGHEVHRIGVYEEGYDLGFVTNQQLSMKRKWLGYPVGLWIGDSTHKMRPLAETLMNYDVVFVDAYDTIGYYEERSRKVEHLSYACEPSVHKAVKAEEIYDVGYIGKYHPERVKRLQTLEKNGLKVYMHISRRHHRLVKTWDFISLNEMCRMYSKCKMIFNRGSHSALNQRVYQAMSIGKLLLTKRIGSEPDNLFVDGEHLVAYDDMDDLLRKAKYYASHPKERNAIAKKGQKLVHEKHKWTDRMKFVIKALGK